MATSLSLRLGVAPKDRCPQERILVVCASGWAARLLEHRYRQEFGLYVEHIETCDAAHVRFVDFSRIDYCVQTVPLAEEVRSRYAKWAIFLDAAEVMTCVKILLSGFAAVRCPPAVLRGFLRMRRASTPEEAIELLVGKASRVYDLSPDFPRFGVSPRADGSDGIRQPGRHSRTRSKRRARRAGPRPHRTNPSIWGGREVQAVFLVSIARDATDPLEGLFSAMF